jgi:starch synthase
MHIGYAASECVPFAKTGGLADVIGALPREMARQGHKVTVYLPYYRQVQKHMTERRVAIPSITIPFHSYNRFVSVLDGGIRDGVQFYFFDSPEFFDREGLYGPQGGNEYSDNWERFGLYSRAVIEAAKQLGIPDLFHVHDWQASLVPVMLRSLYHFDPVTRCLPCLLTIHNADHQGLFPGHIIERLDLPSDVFTVEGLEFYGQANILKGGVIYADTLSTVSPRYAQEIQTKEMGAGLEGVFRKRSADLKGILNGVDYDEWNPATDRKIAAHYKPEQMRGKRDCRRDLMHAFGLKGSENTPVLGIVAWLSTQKGFDLLAEIMPELMTRDLVLVVLGTGEAYYEGLFRSFVERYPGRIGLKIAYDDTMAHKIEAGADIFLMPSRYEPCGLSQIYSLKYGTVPVVHATGGLDDTIQEWDAAAGTGTGFKFYPYEPAAFMAALDRAFGAFANKEAWQTLQRNGMAKDYSWREPAGEYLRLYEESIRRRC